MRFARREHSLLVRIITERWDLRAGETEEEDR